MDRLQPTILGLSLLFEVQRSEFVEVLHIGGNRRTQVVHCTTTIAERKKSCYRCGSTRHTLDVHNDLPSCAKAQTAALFCTSYNMDRVIVVYLH